MKDSVRNDLKKLCYRIIENEEPYTLTEQLAQVQALYERLLLAKHLQEKGSTQPKAAPAVPGFASADAPAAKSAPLTEAPKPEPLASPEKKASAQPTNIERTEKAPAPNLNKEEKEESAASPENGKTEAIQKEKTSASVIPKPKPKPVPGPEAASATEPKPNPASLNDRLAQGNIDIGLNDRIAFVKHLFEGSQADFNRVLSQLNTINSVAEAETFLEQVVQPDYNWDEKEEYVERLLELVRLKLGDSA
jgi:hypothetical protein